VHSTLVDRFNRLTRHRQEHIERVVAVMEKLAEVHQLDREAARLAGYGHDLARELARPELLAEAERLGISYGPEERAEPILLHGPVAARWLKDLSLGNPDVWQAIQYHTTAAPGLSPLAKALFVADGVEPGRRYDGRAALEKLAYDNLEQAYAAVLHSTVQYLDARHLPRHPLTQGALAELNGTDYAPE